MAGSQAVRNAEKFVKNRATIMIGLSCGNSFFDKVENLQKILKFAKENSDEIVVFLPAEIYEHNLRAVGSKNPRRSARAKGNNIRNKCQKAIEACGLEGKSGLTHVNWMADVETSPAYIEALKYVKNLYQVSEAFCTDIQKATERALLSYRKAHGTGLPEDEGPFDIEEGVVYPLKELAFLFAAPKIYNSCEQYVFVYHKQRSLVPDLAKRWLEKFFDGDYDGIVRPYFGFYILEE